MQTAYCTTHGRLELFHDVPVAAEAPPFPVERTSVEKDDRGHVRAFYAERTGAWAQAQRVRLECGATVGVVRTVPAPGQ